ncbi:class I SAM-dependent methyltransferase [Sediminispirochaeta bajacaliforniensis]|uniref:class I SAM-dependent methyltransferase n=1 Tax=Sediminispirochaeta bajacaliforniensis TaxID=148 RepID=UPI000364AC8F|nr:class I SAM-dependent methyltransferase [Sediminispirochaeta bajacaliforniensis]
MILNKLFLQGLNLKAEKEVTEILSCLSLREGSIVADIGSGGGFFAVEFARKIGDTGKVYAVDISGKNLRFLMDYARDKGMESRIIAVLGEENSCLLPAASQDLIFSHNSFHHIARPELYFQSASRAMKSEGRLVVIDRNKEAKGGRHWGHSSSPEDICSAMEAAGLSFESSQEVLKGKSFQIFRKSV